MIKIIAGKYKNRLIPALKNAKYRPTTSKLREAIFSILHFGEFVKYNIFSDSTNVLDLFCGTGSLGFESLSRGAGSVTFVDINNHHLKLIREFADLILANKNCKTLNLDVLNLPQSTKQYNLVFIDPPYHNNLTPKALSQLITKSWLQDKCILIVEIAKTDELVIEDFAELRLLKQKIYGDTKLLILEYIL